MMAEKSAFKGLARMLGPLWFWMAAGWALYPTMMKIIYDDVGEFMDMAEVRSFSLGMVVLSLVLGVISLVYGHMGKQSN